MMDRKTLEDLAETSAALEEAAEAFLVARDPHELPVAAWWAQLIQVGWFDLCRAEQDEGLGLPPVVLGGVIRAAGRHLAPGPLLEGLLVAPWLLRAVGPGACADALLAAATGTSFLSFADPEAGPPGGEPLRIDADGRLSGAVRLVPHAPGADFFAVVVERPDGAAVAVVERAQTGVRVEARETLSDVHPTGDLILDGADALVLETSRDALDELRSWLRVLAAAWLSGVAEQAVAMTVDYVRTREQFGRAVGSFQAVQHTVADMVAASRTMTNLLSLTLGELTSGPATSDGAAALMAKAHSAQTCLEICESALQMHGGIGFTTDYPLHRYYASAMALRGYYAEPWSVFSGLGRRVLATP